MRVCDEKLIFIDSSCNSSIFFFHKGTKFFTVNVLFRCISKCHDANK